MKASILSFLVVITITILAISCQKDELLNPVVDNDGLYLKSATTGDNTSIYFIDAEAGNVGVFYYPADMLFAVEEKNAKILNNGFLKIEDFSFLEEGRAIFRVSEFDSKPLPMGINGTYAPSSENIYANKLPFTVDDYGTQSANARFNGLIKADNYVFAIKDEQVKIHDLTTKKSFTVSSTINGNVLSFQIENTFSLTFQETSPIGNVFELSCPQGISRGYTLAQR